MMFRACMLTAMASLYGAWFVPAVARADGVLLPSDRALPPLELAGQSIRVAIDGPAAVTSIEQTFRNNTSSVLEAEYLFPLPKGASATDFAMWIGGKKVKSETLPADKARSTYEDIVRRMRDPGLLELAERDLVKVRVFPVPAHGEQKIELKYASVLKPDGGVYEYIYPFRSIAARAATAGPVTFVAEIKGSEPLGPVYCPTHHVAIDPRGESSAIVSLEQSGPIRDRDLQLFFSRKTTATGYSLLTFKPSEGEPGYFLLLLSPRTNPEQTPIPRDLVLVLDTSGSMAGEKIAQAKQALAYALASLKPDDRFALVQFATVVGTFRDGLCAASPENLKLAREWVDRLDAAGGTNIADALQSALAMKSGDSSRTFQALFLTDGIATIGVTNPDETLKRAVAGGAAGTRVFAFGVGDDVNTRLLDGLSEATRASTTYVRPGENIEVKVSSLVDKIKKPVLTDLKLTAKTLGGEGAKLPLFVRMTETYPPKLPDLFAGEQLQIAGRYEGAGKLPLVLEGRAGSKSVEEAFELEFPMHESSREFVAGIWARRKVGYLLDQIRSSGESKELRDEVVRLAMRFGIATPYTSRLVLPDANPAVVLHDRFRSISGGRGNLMAGRVEGRSLGGLGGGAANAPAAGASKPATGVAGDAPRAASSLDSRSNYSAMMKRRAAKGKESQSPNDGVSENLLVDEMEGLRRDSGTQAVDVAQAIARLKTARTAMAQAPAERSVLGTKLQAFDGVWVDERAGEKDLAGALKVKVYSVGYFALLKAHPELKDLLALGERIVWKGPSGKLLIIDEDGKESLSAEEIKSLY